MNLAVDGVYLGTREKYVPVDKLPAFPTVMFLIAIIVGTLMNSLMGVCIAIIFSSIIIKIALSNIEPKFGEAKKIPVSFPVYCL